MKARNWNFALPDTELVKVDTICRELCISRSTWYQGVKDGKFPKQIKLTERTSAWRTSDIRALIESQKSNFWGIYGGTYRKQECKTSKTTVLYTICLMDGTPIYKRQTRPLTASGYWTGFVFLRIVSGLRRFQGIGAAAPITPFSGNPSYPASLSPRNSPHSYPHSPDLVRTPAFFPATATRRSRRQTG